MSVTPTMTTVMPTSAKTGEPSRRKVQHGECELAALLRELTGLEVRRRVRQHDGDTDLVGVTGWSVEVKRRASATRGDVACWWAQAVTQAQPAALIPVLFYSADRADRAEWRAVWPLAVHLVIQDEVMWSAYSWAVEGSPEAWAALLRENASGR